MVATKKHVQEGGPKSEENVTEVHHHWNIDLLEIIAPTFSNSRILWV